MGFIVIDELARRLGLGDWKKKGAALQVLDRQHGVLLLKPQSFMNLSGEPTRAVAAFHKIAPRDMLVVVDDLDLPFGKLRMRERGSSGGHNGLKSLIEHFGEEFPRVRIGIGRDAGGEAIGRVLGAFSPREEERLPAIVDAAAHGIELWLARQNVSAVNVVNSWTGPG